MLFRSFFVEKRACVPKRGWRRGCCSFCAQSERDGITKIGVARASGGNLNWYLDSTNDHVYNPGDPAYSPALTGFTFGLATDTPIAGDWTGDGTSKIGVVRENVGTQTAT